MGLYWSNKEFYVAPLLKKDLKRHFERERVFSKKASFSEFLFKFS